MPHATPLIAIIVIGLGLAFILGAIANRLRIPSLAGYLLAGVLVGPHTPGFVADQALASELAEIGVILLMFGVGLHFSLKDLLTVRAIALPGAIAQIAVATALGAGLAWGLGWPLGAGLVFGLALSVASTVVLIRALQERRILDTERGRIAIGWLIVEDMAMVMALVLLPSLASVLGTSNTMAGDPLTQYIDPGIWGVLGLTLLKVATFVALMLLIGRRLIPWVLHWVAHSGSRELFRLAVLSIALGVAFGATQLFGVSLALGAFFAGMVMSESALSQRAAEETLPFRDAFAVLFFVSVGMLFDPASIIREPLPLLATLFIIIVGKSAAAFIIVRAFGHPLGTALTISASLAQIGEFSFILAELGVGLKLLPPEGRDLILSSAILSIMLNPLVFGAAVWLRTKLERHSVHAAVPPVEETADTPPPTSLKDHTILVGFGRVGRLVAEALSRAGTPFLVIEDTGKALADLHKSSFEAIAGNAANPQILEAANIASAQQLIVAIPNAFEAGQIIQQAKAAQPGIVIIARAHLDTEGEHIAQFGADIVIADAEESARGIIRASGCRADAAG